MPRVYSLVVLILLVSCGQEGPRDRSSLLAGPRVPPPRIEAAGQPEPETAPSTPAPIEAPRVKKDPETSTEGLLPDHTLGPLYPDAPLAIVRFDDIVTLDLVVRPRLDEIRQLLPQLKLPVGSARELLRKVLDLPTTVEIEDTRPFALVHIPEGWGVLLPLTDPAALPDARQLNELYVLVGSEEVKAAYKPAGRMQRYLRGHLSVRMTRDVHATMEQAFREAAGVIGLALPELAESTDGDFLRYDVALNVGVRFLRLDYRAAARNGSATAKVLAKLQPGTTESVQYLPPDGTLYFEWNIAPDLFKEIWGERVKDWRVPSFLTGDLACMLDLDPHGNALLIMVAKVSDPEAAANFLGSEQMKEFFTVGTENDPRFKWEPAVFERHGIAVGALTGQLPRALKEAWEKSGNPMLATLAGVADGPTEAFSGVLKDKVFLVAGHRSRAETERYLDRFIIGAPEQNDHTEFAGRLLHKRVAGVTVDLAALFDGTREAAYLWHKSADRLSDLTLRWPIPGAMAVTVEHGTVRAAVQVRMRAAAQATQRILDVLKTARQAEKK